MGGIHKLFAHCKVRMRHNLHNKPAWGTGLYSTYIEFVVTELPNVNVRVYVDAFPNSEKSITTSALGGNKLGKT